MCGNPPNHYNTLQTKRGLLRSFLPRNDVTFLAEWHPSKHYVIANVVRQSPSIASLRLVPDNNPFATYLKHEKHYA